MSASFRKISAEIKAAADSSQAAILQRFFKTAPGQYGAGDVFLGLKVPVQRQMAIKYQALERSDIAALLESRYHEFRLIGLLILVRQYELSDDYKFKKALVDFYLQKTSRINNWDLVDLSAYKILGNYLLSQNTGKSLIPPILKKLAQSKNLWERRIAMVSTYAFIKNRRSDTAFALAKELIADKHDLMHKAVGWMLREAGKVDKGQLLAFLDQRATQMPRTALRYAIEKFTLAERRHYLALKAA